MLAVEREDNRARAILTFVMYRVGLLDLEEVGKGIPASAFLLFLFLKTTHCTLIHPLHNYVFLPT